MAAFIHHISGFCLINKNLPIELSKEALVIYPSLEVSSEMVMHLTKSDVLSKFLTTRADVKLVARQSKSTRLFLFDSHQGRRVPLSIMRSLLIFHFQSYSRYFV